MDNNPSSTFTFDASQDPASMPLHTPTDHPTSEPPSTNTSMPDQPEKIKLIWGTTINIAETIETFKHIIATHYAREMETLFYLDQSRLVVRDLHELNEMCMRYPAELIPILRRGLNEYVLEKQPSQKKTYDLEINIRERRRAATTENCVTAEKGVTDRGNYSVTAENGVSNHNDYNNTDENNEYNHNKYRNTDEYSNHADGVTSLRNLSTGQIDKIVRIKGIAIHISTIIPELLKACYTCTSCAKQILIDKIKNVIQEPGPCDCGATFSYALYHAASLFRDKQVVKMQELESEQEPLTINVVTHDIDRVSPGDKVVVCGILKAAPVLNCFTKKVKNVFRGYVEMLAVEHESTVGMSGEYVSSGRSGEYVSRSDGGSEYVSRSDGGVGVSRSDGGVGVSRSDGGSEYVSRSDGGSEYVSRSDSSGRSGRSGEYDENENGNDGNDGSPERNAYFKNAESRNYDLSGNDPSESYESRRSHVGQSDHHSNQHGTQSDTHSNQHDSQSKQHPYHSHSNQHNSQSQHSNTQSDQRIRNSDRYEVLSSMISPSVYGHGDVKKGILLMMVGAVPKRNFNSVLRGSINVLLAGDPGVAKSQLLTFVNRHCKGIYTSGQGSSAVGLSATVVRDAETGNFVLESGALVLSDNGICCIDEFDKMGHGSRGVLHEAMEQQTVSIAKAGVIASLNCRCSILASCNPAGSVWSSKRNILENVNLPAALLSRFDLIFILLDRNDREEDERTAGFILGNYNRGRISGGKSVSGVGRGGKDSVSGGRDSSGVGRGGDSGVGRGGSDSVSGNDSGNTISGRRGGNTISVTSSGNDSGNTISGRRDTNTATGNDVVDDAINDSHLIDNGEFDMKFLNRCIAQSKRIIPLITTAAKVAIEQEYVNLRLLNSGKTITATTRQLEAIIRLSEAHARVRLSTRIEVVDVREAVRLIRDSMLMYAVDPLTGKLDLDLVVSGRSAEQRRETEEVKKGIVGVLKRRKRCGIGGFEWEERRVREAVEELCEEEIVAMEGDDVVLID